MSGDPPQGWSGYPTVNTAQCGCHQGAWWGVQPPPMCPMHAMQRATCAAPPSFTGVSAMVAWPPVPPRMSDDDVERIAKRVAEIMGEAP